MSSTADTTKAHPSIDNDADSTSAQPNNKTDFTVDDICNLMRELSKFGDVKLFLINDDDDDDDEEDPSTCEACERASKEKVHLTKEEKKVQEDFELISASIDDLFDHPSIAKFNERAFMVKKMMNMLNNGKDPMPAHIGANARFYKIFESTVSNFTQACVFMSVWNRTYFDSNIPWHQMVVDCSENYRAGLPFENLSENLFPQDTVMSKLQKMLKRVYDDLKKLIQRAVDTDAKIEHRVTLPFAADMIKLFGPIAEYLNSKVLNDVTS